MDRDAQQQQCLNARDTVYRLLKFRTRSEYEIRIKLKDKKIASAVIDETIFYFKDLELIDDRQFAKKWISSRLLKPFGTNRIRHELESKGIDPTILQEELAQAMKDYSEEDIVLHLAQNQIRRYQGIEPAKARQRLYGFLARKGFSSQSIIKALNTL